MNMAIVFDLAMLAALLSAGALATLCAARIFPLWLLERAQPHGRFAGLEGGAPAPGAGGGKGGRTFPAARWVMQPHAA